MGKVGRRQKGMVLIESLLILVLVLLIMKSGLEFLLEPYRVELQKIQRERLVYDGEQLWRD